jgi:hypothetical protein
MLVRQFKSGENTDGYGLKAGGGGGGGKFCEQLKKKFKIGKYRINKIQEGCMEPAEHGFVPVAEIMLSC